MLVFSLTCCHLASQAVVSELVSYLYLQRVVQSLSWFPKRALCCAILQVDQPVIGDKLMVLNPIPTDGLGQRSIHIRTCKPF